MNNKSDKRDFVRIPMEIVLEVSAEDREENQFNEKTVLKDISGGGAKFMTQLPGKYFPGQLLEMIVNLSGTNLCPHLDSFPLLKEPLTMQFNRPLKCKMPPKS